MAAFAYVAVDRSGKRTTGVIVADSKAAAIDSVLAQGLSPVSVNESAPNDSRSGGLIRRKGKISQHAVETFTRELSNLLAAGLSISRALALLKREASNPAAREAWTKIHDDVVGGQSLADSLMQFPQAFSSVYVAMVRAGETGGFLHVVLQQIADFRQRDQDLKSKVRSALIYPVALACIASGVMIFLLTYFIPKFGAIFAQFGDKLPTLTRVVAGLSGLLLQYGIIVLIAGAIGIFVLRRWLLTESGRRTWEKLLLSMPLLGTVMSRFALVRFARMLGTLVGAGVPLVASLKTAREAIGNQILADSVTRAIEQVQRGTSLSKALSENRKLFPASVIEMIAVAEETGRVDQELIRLATTYESDLDRQLRTLVALAEPLLLIVMAALIGTVVVSMLLPVFTLQDMIN
ncbi:MAG: phytochrome sensor protein [Phycisphaerae bacterium]|jgi:type II secretory pathway component PulF|nr:MAG: phytochrome sensor protein [Phycisphaerae bacterium]